MTATTLTADHLGLIHALKSTQQKIADLTDVAEHLKAQLIDALGDADEAHDPAGNLLLTYRTSRRFDADKAAALISPEQLEAAQKLTLDTTKLKKLLTGDQLDDCMVDSGSRRFVLVNA